MFSVGWREETLATRHIHGHPGLPDSLTDQVTDGAPVPRGSRLAPGSCKHSREIKFSISAADKNRAKIRN